MKPISAGKMRDLVIIQRQRNVDDGGGGSPPLWEDVGKAWAKVTTIPASSWGNIEQFEMGQLRYVQHFNVQMRYGGEISNEYRILFGGHKLRVISVVDVNVMRWEINLYCREGG